jgi:DNA-binding CsgD family transcriptional regulator
VSLDVPVLPAVFTSVFRSVFENPYLIVCDRSLFMRNAVRAGMARYRVPGVALGVVDRGAEHVAGFGLTSVEHPLPVDGETLFQIASITKTLVATGGTNADIGRALHISEATVKTHLLRVFGKLGVSDRTAAVTTARARNLLG